MAVNKIIYGGNTLVDLTGDTVTAADLAEGVKATGADGNPIVGIMQKVTIDAELSNTSTNPVQNKVIYNALLGKVGTDIFSGFALMGATSTIAWRQGSQHVGSINATNYTGTAAKATQDGAGNVITKTYAKKDTANTWTAEQSLNNVNITLERYTSSAINGTSATPTTSTAVYTATGNFTLDLNSIAGNLTNGQTTVFTAYINATADYALNINIDGVISYIGKASDIAITSAGLLLIVFISRLDNSITCIVQASKLS